MNRRTFIKGAVIAASTPAAIGIAGYDPILNAIMAYRAGLVEFNRLAAGDHDDKRWSEYAEATFEPWQTILDEWDEPARTREGAIEALRAALSEEDGVYGSDAAERMMRAALGYLEALPA